MKTEKLPIVAFGVSLSAEQPMKEGKKRGQEGGKTGLARFVHLIWNQLL